MFFLPWDIILEILLFDSRFILHKKYTRTLLFIDRIPRNDERYSLLSKKPRIYHMSTNQWSVILSEPTTKKRFILECRRNYHSQWEYYFHVFTYNYQMREMNKLPDTTILF